MILTAVVFCEYSFSVAIWLGLGVSSSSPNLSSICCYHCRWQARDRIVLYYFLVMPAQATSTVTVPISCQCPARRGQWFADHWHWA